jgi:prolyl 4-hydroxylase
VVLRLKAVYIQKLGPFSTNRCSLKMINGQCLSTQAAHALKLVRSTAQQRPTMLTEAQIDALKVHALEGDGEACMQLARLFDKAGQHDVAFMWYKEAIANGHTPAMTALGARLMIGKAAPQDVRAGATLIAEAAARQHPEACALEAMLATAGIGRPQSFSEAGDYLLRAAQLDAPRAREQLALFVSDPTQRAQLIHGETAGGIQWTQVRAALNLAAFVQSPPPEVLHSAPRILVVRNFLPPMVCRYLIDRAKPKLAAARVNDPAKGGARTASIRTNTGMGFSLIEMDVVLQAVAMKIAAATTTQVSQQEATNILHYAPGEQYAPHFDFLDPGAAQFAGQLARLGQRIATCLIYLNDDYGGGETAFPDLHWRFKGNAGDALIFYNLDAAGRPDPHTLHAGLPTKNGEKWLLSQWIRDRGQPVA